MKKNYKTLLLALLLITAGAMGQTPAEKVRAQKESRQLEKQKQEGTLDLKKYDKPHTRTQVLQNTDARHYPVTNSVATVAALCKCDVPQDTSFVPVPFDGTGCSGTPGVPPEYRNDDGFTATPIALPFNFEFYGTTYNSVYIDNNGNVCFNSSFCTFTANGFPDATHAMIAPFWSDNDTRDLNSGIVYYKLTAHALIVKWDTVGYYFEHVDLKNTYQLILTDGTDPLLPPGYNVSFCYGDMQWTTGDASGGTGGFGGTPATVGANAGDGINYVQIGTFGQPGTTYNGVTGNSGVDFLDHQAFFLNTSIATGTTNIPPIVHGLTICDTAIICALDTAFRDTIPINFSFLSPEQSQITTVTVTGPPSLTIFNNTPGNIVDILGQFIITYQNAGLSTLTFIATDNGTPPASDTIVITYKLDTFSLAPPTISGPHFYCQGGPGVTLQVPTGFQTYMWNDSVTTTDSIHVMTGTYNVIVTDQNGCQAKTPAFPVWEVTPSPQINGVTAICGQDSAHLQTTIPYVSYQWSPGNQTTASINAATGTYTVTVTDSIGCTATSAPVTVSIHNYPTVNYVFTPVTGLPGDTIHFTDISTPGNGTTIVSWLWHFGDGDSSILQNPMHVYTALGTYTVTLTVTQSDGCSSTFTRTYTGEPNPVIAPNIFTPNGDGKNDVFFFKNLEFYPNSKLEVFNRWGRKVFESSNYDNKWDGGGLSDGVYYYILKSPDKDALTGTVTIQR